MPLECHLVMMASGGYSGRPGPHVELVGVHPGHVAGAGLGRIAGRSVPHCHPHAAGLPGHLLSRSEISPLWLPSLCPRHFTGLLDPCCYLPLSNDFSICV